MVYCVMQLNYWRHHGRLKSYQYQSLWKLLLWEWLKFLNLKGCLLTWVELYLYHVGKNVAHVHFYNILQIYICTRTVVKYISFTWFAGENRACSVLEFQNDMILVRKLEWFDYKSLCIAQNGYHCTRKYELCVVTWLKIIQ